MTKQLICVGSLQKNLSCQMSVLLLKNSSTPTLCRRVRAQKWMVKLFWDWFCLDFWQALSTCHQKSYLYQFIDWNESYWKGMRFSVDTACFACFRCVKMPEFKGLCHLLKCSCLSVKHFCGLTLLLCLVFNLNYSVSPSIICIATI